MIKENLEEYMKHIKIINKDLSEYINEEIGIKYLLNTPQLLTRVDKLELTKNELEVAKFNGQIEKKEYKMHDAIRPVPKNTITKKDEDKYTLVDSKIKATCIYNVSNQIGINKAFEDKEEAFKYSNNINNKVIAELK